MAKESAIFGDTGGFMRVREVAEFLSLSVSHTKTLIQAGEFPGTIRTTGNHYRVPRKALDTYLAARRVKPQAVTP